jgi:hypothetical protein
MSAHSSHFYKKWLWRIAAKRWSEMSPWQSGESWDICFDAGLKSSGMDWVSSVASLLIFLLGFAVHILTSWVEPGGPTRTESGVPILGIFHHSKNWSLVFIHSCFVGFVVVSSF